MCIVGRLIFALSQKDLALWGAIVGDSSYLWHELEEYNGSIWQRLDEDGLPVAPLGALDDALDLGVELEAGDLVAECGAA